MPIDYLLRPMIADDVAPVERITDEAFHDADQRLRRLPWPDPQPRTTSASAHWRERAEHLVRTDPRGCWVAQDRHGLLGATLSMRRDSTWLLATLAVRPGVQGRGMGRQLLTAALEHRAACRTAMVAASDDPLAARRYRLAGLTLHPAMLLHGRVPRSALPVVEHVREGSLGDLDLLSSVDRHTRGAAHGKDHEVLARQLRLAVSDRHTGSGYVFFQESGPKLLAATNRRTATALLWEALAATSPDEDALVPHVTAANEWAVDVGTACRLSLWTSGYLALRGMKPPMPYLHHGGFL